MELTKTKRNFLVTLLSFMVGMIYFIPYIRISFYDQTIAALRLPGVWLVGLFIFFCYALNCGGAYYFGTYTTQVLHTSEAVSSSLQILRTYILAIGLGIVGGVVIDKFRYRSRFLILSLAGATAASALLPFLSGQIWVAIVVSVLISGINYMIKSVYYSIMDEALIPRNLAGAASGVIAFLAYVPDAFITAMVGVWLDQDMIGGFHKLFAFMAFCGVAAMILAAIINKRYLKSVSPEKQ